MSAWDIHVGATTLYKKSELQQPYYLQGQSSAPTLSDSLHEHVAGGDGRCTLQAWSTLHDGNYTVCYSENIKVQER